MMDSFFLQGTIAGHRKNNIMGFFLNLNFINFKNK
jgi:hypothetical protein